jgi:S-adenosylmethionine:tRNA ribosyltransferase-isomerase
MKLSDFHFDVPTELIAQVPATPRDSSRLMVLRRETGSISHHVFRDLPDLLDERYTLVVNNSRVIKAKLEARRANGEPIVIFLLKDLGSGLWSCLGDSMSMPEPGEAVRFDGSAMTATLVERHADGTVDFRFTGVPDMLAEVERIGALPLPPYIGERTGEHQYQTVFAKEAGSVAAPTAGLHFTDEVFEGLAARGVAKEEVTLHVGYGTFARVNHEELASHPMHAERYTVDAQAAERLNAYKREGRRILSVGTTATRVLESCADASGVLRAGSGDTNIFIYPPHRWRFVDALLTNFHMPGFTPVMLVAAIAGHDLTMRAYEEAIRERYRFYSFGDAMLIL